MNSKNRKYIPPDELIREILTVIIFSLAINVITSIELKFYYILSLGLVSLSSYYIFLYTRIDVRERSAIDNTLLFEKAIFSAKKKSNNDLNEIPLEEKTKDDLFLRWVRRKRILTEERFEKHELTMKQLWNKAIVTCILGTVFLFVNQSPYVQTESQQQKYFVSIKKEIDLIKIKIDSSNNKVNSIEKGLADLYSQNSSNLEPLKIMHEETRKIFIQVENILNEVQKNRAKTDDEIKSVKGISEGEN